jgi:hypothetical protein
VLAEFMGLQQQQNGEAWFPIGTGRGEILTHGDVANQVAVRTDDLRR